MLSSIEIGLATFREARRNKILYSTLFFGVVILLNSFLASEVTIHSQERILRDTGLGAMALFGVLIAIFLSAGIVNREIDRRTIYTVIAKPVSRAEYIIGKVLGVGLTLAVTLGIMLLALLGELALMGASIEHQLLVAIFGLAMQLMVVVSFGVLTSTFTTPALSAFFCGSLFVLGSLSRDLRFFGNKSESPWVRQGAEWLYLLLPDLRNLNFSVEATHSLPIDAGALAHATAYGLLWSACYVALAIAIFVRRDFR